MLFLNDRAAAIKRQQAGALDLTDLSGFAAQGQGLESMEQFKRIYEYYLDTQKKKIQAKQGGVKRLEEVIKSDRNYWIY